MRQNVWRIGTIDSNEYSELSPKGQARVFFTDKQPGILSKPLPILFPATGTDKVYFMPKIGDRVVVLTDENSEDGIIMGSIYSKQNQPLPDSEDKHTIEFEDGTRIEYDKGQKILTIEVVEGDVRIKGDNIYLN